MNADRSASAHTRHVRARALNNFRVNNPTAMEGGKLKPMSGDAHIVRMEGSYAYTRVVEGAPNLVERACCPAPEPRPTICPPEITGFTFAGTGDDLSPWSFSLVYVWDSIEGNPSLSGSILWYPEVSDTTYSIVFQSNTQMTVYSNSSSYDVVLTATAPGCPTRTAQTAPCFLAGALVTVASGNEVPIERIMIGDRVLGAFGEINTVLALHRPLLNNNTMTVINDEHHTSSHHPHVSADKKFYAAKPSVATERTYGRSHPVIMYGGEVVERYLEGLKPERILPLELGVRLKTIEGSREVKTFSNYSLPPETQLYNLVLDGSHTYFVDGYAVTGWPNESDFNYDTWTQK